MNNDKVLETLDAVLEYFEDWAHWNGRAEILVNDVKELRREIDVDCTCGCTVCTGICDEGTPEGRSRG